ncbi:G2/mitotic-specific cyclin S13-7-like protein [Tanacetum coccineum]
MAKNESKTDDYLRVVNIRDRMILIEWLIEVQESLKLTNETLYQTSTKRLQKHVEAQNLMTLKSLPASIPKTNSKITKNNYKSTILVFQSAENNDTYNRCPSKKQDQPTAPECRTLPPKSVREAKERGETTQISSEVSHRSMICGLLTTLKKDAL